MADLIAQGPAAEDRWRRTLPPHEEVVVGRTSAGWAVTWDDRISRQHATLRLVDGTRLEVTRVAESRNPIFFRGARCERFTLGPGEHFVIGRTTFTLALRPDVSEAPVPEWGMTQHTFAPGQLGLRNFQDAAGRIAMLSRLPELISGSASDSELLVRVATVLMQATPAAAAVAILRVGSASGAVGAVAMEPQVDVLHYDCRLPAGQMVQPSATLARQATVSGESVLHVWGAAGNRAGRDGGMREGGSRSAGSGEGAYTASEHVDWAFAVPVRGEAAHGWCLYVTGSQGAGIPGVGRGSSARTEAVGGGHDLSDASRDLSDAPRGLQDDVKFTEIVASMLGNLRKMRLLQQRQAGLARFFAPVVMDALAGKDPQDVLQPREADIAVLFCDLRGFSRRSEAESEQLMDLLRRVSDALGIMTRSILAEGGVIGDFHGDAAMGFWGWPLAQEDAAARACRAALDISRRFREERARSSGALGGFRCGVGVACGRAVAGRIGTTDQVKVTAFGPVVNLASRLEGMTKALSAEILIDETTAEFVRAHVPSAVARVRRLARVRPRGMQAPMMLHQLLPPVGSAELEGDASLPDEAGVAAYEAALDAVLGGDWEHGFRLLHEVPPGDRVKDFLTVFIASHGRVAPEDWDGVIPVPS